VCRFRFPRDISNASKIVEEPADSNMYRFIGCRNDARVNSHNRAVLQAWRGNIDWSPVTTVDSVTKYIGKYAAKSEPASKNFIDTLRGIVDDQLRPCHDSSSVIKRLLIKSASERDIPAQENCHILMSYPLTKSSRKVVLLNLSETSLFSSQLRWKRHVDSGEHGVTNPTFFRRYLERPENLWDMTLIEVAKTHHFDRGRWKKYRTEVVVRIIPEIGDKVIPNTDQFESFCRQQVLLKSCYRSLDEAKRGFQTWAECYAELPCANENQDVELPMAEDEFSEEIEPEEEFQEEWMILAGMKPNFGPVDDVNLGLRSIDVNHDWTEGFRSFPLTEHHIKFTSTLGKDGHVLRSSTGPDTSITVLSDQQKAALNLVQKSLKDGLSIRLIVSGGAGTGKSTLINALVRLAREMFGNDKAVRIMAPTGVAAFNIGGSTIHHELAITTDRNHSYKKLETQRCGSMQ
ncbi:hypothetical protein MKW94_006297, partial [Papaver nudicaule]|nr:hypothetical protein [Papaver nudicaule]